MEKEEKGGGVEGGLVCGLIHEEPFPGCSSSLSSLISSFALSFHRVLLIIPPTHPPNQSTHPPILCLPLKPDPPPGPGFFPMSWFFVTLGSSTEAESVLTPSCSWMEPSCGRLLLLSTTMSSSPRHFGKDGAFRVTERRGWRPSPPER